MRRKSSFLTYLIWWWWLNYEWVTHLKYIHIYIPKVCGEGGGPTKGRRGSCGPVSFFFFFFKQLRLIKWQCLHLIIKYSENVSVPLINTVLDPPMGVSPWGCKIKTKCDIVRLIRNDVKSSVFICVCVVYG